MCGIGRQASLATMDEKNTGSPEPKNTSAVDKIPHKVWVKVSSFLQDKDVVKLDTEVFKTGILQGPQRAGAMGFDKGLPRELEILDETDRGRKDFDATQVHTVTTRYIDFNAPIVHAKIRTLTLLDFRLSSESVVRLAEFLARLTRLKCLDIRISDLEYSDARGRATLLRLCLEINGVQPNNEQVTDHVEKLRLPIVTPLDTLRLKSPEELSLIVRDNGSLRQIKAQGGGFLLETGGEYLKSLGVHTFGSCVLNGNQPSLKRLKVRARSLRMGATPLLKKLDLSDVQMYDSTNPSESVKALIVSTFSYRSAVASYPNVESLTIINGRDVVRNLPHLKNILVVGSEVSTGPGLPKLEHTRKMSVATWRNINGIPPPRDRFRVAPRTVFPPHV